MPGANSTEEKTTPIAPPAPGTKPAPTPTPNPGIFTEKPPAPGQPSTDKNGQLSFTGLVFSPDGSRIFLSNVNGSLKEFAVAKDGKVTATRTLALPDARSPKRKNDIPAGIAVTPDGKRLYVALNLGNKLAEIEIESGKTLRTFDVGVAPYDVVLHGGKAYVSNTGGRRPGPKDLTGPAGRGMTVRVDPARHIASEGSVSIVDLLTGKVKAELLTGHPAQPSVSGLAALSPRRTRCGSGDPRSAPTTSGCTDADGPSALLLESIVQVAVRRSTVVRNRTAWFWQTNGEGFWQTNGEGQTNDRHCHRSIEEFFLTRFRGSYSSLCFNLNCYP